MGGNVIDKVKCEHKYASDVQPYLIAVLKQAQKDTSVFPKTITLEEYKEVKDNKEKYPIWYIGLVGFCASYGGKFFNGEAFAIIMINLKINHSILNCLVV